MSVFEWFCKSRCKEMLWLITRLMAHDLSWKFFSERYQNSLIKRVISKATISITCTGTKGKAPCEPTRNTVQLTPLMSHPLSWTLPSCSTGARTSLHAVEASKINSPAHEAGSTPFPEQRDWQEDSFSSLWQRKPFSDEVGAFWASSTSANTKGQGSVQEGRDEERERGTDL